MKTIKFLGVALAAAFMASAANATSFYLDVGADYGGIGAKADGANTTGVFDQATVTYWSTTTVTDANGDGVYSPGDTVVGTGGLQNVTQFGVGNAGITENLVTGFVPTASIGDPTGPALNGYNANWLLSFGWNDLTGVVNAGGGITYTGGTINVFFIDSNNPFAGAASTIVLKIAVEGGGINAIGQSLNLAGAVSFDGLDPNSALNAGVLLADLFNLEDGTSFYDYLQTNPEVMINALIDQNTEPFFLNGVASNTFGLDEMAAFYGGIAGGSGVISAQHDGSIVFAIPEPASLALLGLGALALGFVARRRLVI